MRFSLKTSTAIVCVIDLLGSFAVPILCYLAWKREINHAKPLFLHQRNPKEAVEVYNDVMNVVVSYWVLAILATLAFVKLILVQMAYNAHKNRSTNAGRCWILLKFTGLFMGMFVLIGSLTVGTWLTYAAFVDLGLSFLTLYHIKMLVEAFVEFERGLLNDRIEKQ